MDIKKIQEETAKMLGVSVDKVGYITEELLNDYRLKAKSVSESESDADGEINESETGEKGLWGTYGNTITFDEGLTGNVYWKQNPKATPDYGCGTSEDWKAPKNWASNIVYRGTCDDGVDWFFIGNYSG